MLTGMHTITRTYRARSLLLLLFQTSLLVAFLHSGLELSASLFRFLLLCGLALALVLLYFRMPQVIRRVSDRWLSIGLLGGVACVSREVLVHVTTP